MPKSPPFFTSPSSFTPNIPEFFPHHKAPAGQQSAADLTCCQELSGFGLRVLGFTQSPGLRVSKLAKEGFRVWGLWFQLGIWGPAWPETTPESLQAIPAQETRWGHHFHLESHPIPETSAARSRNPITL